LAYENYIEEQAAIEPRVAKKPDRRRISDLVKIWYNSHGQIHDDSVQFKKILNLFANQ